MGKDDIAADNLCHIRKHARIPLGRLGTCELFRCRDVADVSQLWEQLQRNNSFSPFQQVSWIQALLAGAPNSTDTQNHVFVVGFVDDAPVLILPLKIRISVLGNQLVWLGEKISDYNGAIVDSAFAANAPGGLLVTILGLLHKALPDIHAVHLIRNPVNGYVGAQDAAPGTGKLTAEYSSHALALHTDWKQLYKTIRSASSIQRLRSKNRALQRTGSIRFSRVRGSDERWLATAQILQWKSDHLNQSGNRNPFDNNDNANPVRTAIESDIQSRDGSLEVFGLFQDGKMIAGMLAFVTGKKFYYYVSSFSPDVGRKFSVGTLLLVKTLELAARAGLGQYDFLIGDEPYKLDWCDTRIELFHYTCSFTLRGRLICALIALRLTTKKFLLRHPKLVGLLKSTTKYARNYVRAAIFDKQPSNAPESVSKISENQIEWAKSRKQA